MTAATQAAENLHATQRAAQARRKALAPWLLISAIPVVVVILAFNFLGDGLRDAADPYG